MKSQFFCLTFLAKNKFFNFPSNYFKLRKTFKDREDIIKSLSEDVKINLFNKYQKFPVQKS